MQNLRSNLLKGNKIRPSEEQSQAYKIQSYLAGKVDFLPEVESVRCPITSLDHISSLGGSVKYAIATWIRKCLMLHMCGQNWDRIQDLGTASQNLDLNPRDFDLIRAVLEQLEDFAILADVLVIVISQSNDSLLIDAAIIVANRHFDVFHALGAMDNLFCKLVSRIGRFHRRDPSHKSFLLSLIDLGERLPRMARTVTRLRKEIMLREPRINTTAFSPISEPEAETPQSADATFFDEMELLFSSGSSMDRLLICKVFQKIVMRLDHAWGNASIPIDRCIDFLTRLRSFDVCAFDSLMLDWLQGLILRLERPQLLSIFLPLICSGTVLLENILSRFLALTSDDASQSQNYAKCAVEILHLLAIKEPEVFTLKIEVRTRIPLSILHLLNNLAAEILPVDHRHRISRKESSRHTGLSHKMCASGKYMWQFCCRRFGTSCNSRRAVLGNTSNHLGPIS